MKIYISSGEKRISLSVNPTDTISQLKKYISDSREFDELKQKIFRRKEEKETTQYIIQNPQLVFNASLLYRISPLVDDRRTIDSYQIKEGGTIKILRNYEPGGGGLCPINFVDVGKNVITHLEFSNNAPKWRIVKRGLNLFGICKNENCEGFDKEVIFSGNGIINLAFNLNQNIENIKCPICDFIIIPKTCGFYKCEYQFVGDKIENGKKIHFDSAPKETEGDKFDYFDPYSGGSVMWLNLIIYVLEKQNKKYT